MKQNINHDNDAILRTNSEIHTSNKRKLGRGIASLLGVDDGFEVISTTEHGDFNKNTNGIFSELDIENVISNPNQPRKNFDDLKLHELSESIKNSGLLQPITVIKAKNPADLGKYLIIAGERRFRASKLAGLKTIKALVLNLKDEEILKNAILENVQREDLNPIEEASGYRNIIDTFNYTHARLAKEIGKSRVYITNLLRILTLPDDVKKALEDGAISLGHAKVLLSVENPGKYLTVIIEEHLSVRKLEKIIADNISLDNADLEKDEYSQPTDAILDIKQQLSKFRDLDKDLKIKNNINHGLSLDLAKGNILASSNKDWSNLKDKIKTIEKHLSDSFGFDFKIKLYYNGNGKCEISFKNFDDLLKLIKLFY